ncbi:hypothetical protein SIM22_06410 [Bacillus cereus group sp. BfR-BA-01363]|uniref:hypothetical protein n=1 Tax=Bacillus cereus group sp. BfR-BA-01363 TaxID=3094882 RepID=UPI0029C140EB|nr:hypothetical protein [Bacillus cereus group sp. BfR-BA-01363]MDX5853738.1 hypothetical protein [Bacillus cereus group sp. BfR-BA-01363]
MNKITVKNTDDIQKLYAEMLLTPFMIYSILNNQNQLELKWNNHEGYTRILNVLSRYITKVGFKKYGEIEMRERGFEEAYISACLSHELLQKVEQMSPLVEITSNKLGRVLESQKLLDVETFILFNTSELKRSVVLFVDSMEKALTNFEQGAEEKEEKDVSLICFQTLINKGKSLRAFEHLELLFVNERVEIKDSDGDIYTSNTMQKCFGIELYDTRVKMNSLIHDLSFVTALALLMETESITISYANPEFLDLLKTSFDEFGLTIEVQVND